MTTINGPLGPNRIYINVDVQIAIDRDVWEQNYGKDETPVEIGDFVTGYTGELLAEDFKNRGLTAKVGVHKR